MCAVGRRCSASCASPCPGLSDMVPSTIERRLTPDHSSGVLRWMALKFRQVFKLCRQCQLTRWRSGPLPIPRAVPNSDRLIRAPFNNRDYGRHAQTLFCGLRPEMLTDVGTGAVQFGDGITKWSCASHGVWCSSEGMTLT